MAEVILAELESIDSALKRFKQQIGREGTVREAKSRHFNGFVTKSERRRGKKLASRRRLRRFMKNQPRESGRVDSVKAESELRFDDTSWAIGSDNWHPDLTPVRMKKPEDRQRQITGPASFYGFGENARQKTEPLPLTIHVCGIAEYTCRHKAIGRVTGLIIVRSVDDYGNPRQKLSFPGGGVEKGETPWQAIVREFQEETGLKIAPPEEGHRIFSTEIYNLTDNHLFICYLVRVIGGRPKPGEEIVELKLVPFEKLEKFVFEAHGLSFNHMRSFWAYDERKKAGALPALPKIIRTRRATKKEVADVSAKN